jgi:hypothetical protein
MQRFGGLNETWALAPKAITLRVIARLSVEIPDQANGLCITWRWPAHGQIGRRDLPPSWAIGASI